MPETGPIPPDIQPSETPETAKIFETPGSPQEHEPPQPEENAKEHAPMLDVHMPHATHTWKDFLIHIATISVGLLIAVSLEQTVEYFHHLHERHVLEDQFKAEGQENKEIAEIDFAELDDRMEWLLGLQQDIEIMRATGGKANLPYRAVHYRPRGNGYEGAGLINLSTAVWDASKGTERFALLPDELGHLYTRIYRQAETYRDLLVEGLSASMKQVAFGSKFAESGSPLTPVLSRMGPAELSEYEGLVTAQFAITRQTKATLKNFYGDDLAFLDGLRGDHASVAKQQDVQRQFPDDFKKMAAEIQAGRVKEAK